MTGATTSALLEALGPQSVSDSLASQRARFHQSWFRASVLKVEYGASRSTRGRPSGAVLDERSGAAGLNFVDTVTHFAFLARHAEGWGVDPVQTSRHLVSSQALMFNIFAPLLQRPEHFMEVLSLACGRSDLVELVSFAYEYAPANRGEYLNDMTRIDAIARVRTTTAMETIAFEVKYVDRFNSRVLDLRANPNYEMLQRTRRCWRDVELVCADPRLNQLTRVHALAASIAAEHGDERLSLIGLHRSADVNAGSILREYGSHATDAVVPVTIDAWVSAMSAVVGTTASQLAERYLRYEHSEALWREFRGHSA